jgi:hypothetical protein
VSGYYPIMRPLFVLILIASFTGSSTAKADPAQSQKRPAFSDYPVSEVYQGPPAQPILNAEQRRFRTRIRSGAKSAVEFAGHYTVPRWGCGAGCTYFVIVDSISGRVYEGSFGVEELPGSWEEKHIDNLPSRMDFQPDSRLMKVNGCPNERDCGFYDYIMVEGEGLKLIRKRLLPKEFQY